MNRARQRPRSQGGFVTLYVLAVAAFAALMLNLAFESSIRLHDLNQRQAKQLRDAASRLTNRAHPSQSVPRPDKVR